MIESSTKLLNWSQEVSLEYVTSSESAILEAKAYFSKRQPSILACLKTLVEHYNPEKPKSLITQTHASTKPECVQSVDLSKKDPPTIVSSRMKPAMADGYVDTETSETVGSGTHNKRQISTDRQHNENSTK